MIKYNINTNKAVCKSFKSETVKDPTTGKAVRSELEITFRIPDGDFYYEYCDSSEESKCEINGYGLLNETSSISSMSNTCS